MIILVKYETNLEELFLNQQNARVELSNLPKLSN